MIPCHARSRSCRPVQRTVHSRGGTLGVYRARGRSFRDRWGREPRASAGCAEQQHNKSISTVDALVLSLFLSTVSRLGLVHDEARRADARDVRTKRARREPVRRRCVGASDASGRSRSVCSRSVWRGRHASAQSLTLAHVRFAAGKPRKPSWTNPLGLPAPLTGRQVFYVGFLQCIGAAAIDGAINFGIA